MRLLTSIVAAALGASGSFAPPDHPPCKSPHPHATKSRAKAKRRRQIAAKSRQRNRKA